MRRIGELFKHDPQLTRVMRWQERIQRCQQAMQASLPGELATYCRVTSQEGSTLIIVAANNAVAARVRQYTPRIANALREAGIPVFEIKLRVDHDQQAERPQAERHFSPHAAEALGELKEHLPDGALKATLARFLARRR